MNTYGNKNISSNTTTMSHENFPFRISDTPLPQCNAGYVYMLLSLRDKPFTYIGAKFSLCTRIQQHISGNGSQLTEPFHLSTNAVIAYICGFNDNYDLMFHVERQWKRNRDELQHIRVNIITYWFLGGN